MPQPRIQLNTEKTTADTKQNGRERKVLLYIVMATVVTIGSGVLYGYDFGSKPPAKAKPVLSTMSQLCQQKLLKHIEQGSLDLQQQLSFGNLQGCNFSSKSEQARAADSSQSWRME